MDNEIKLPDVNLPTQEDLEDSQIKLLTPRQQRFVHMYLSGQYQIKQIAELLNMSTGGVRNWLKNPQIKSIIEEVQTEEDDIVRQGLKAIRLSALYKMQNLLNSPIDGIAYQAARDILDRTGHKAPTKQETKIEIYTFEQQLKDAIQQIDKPDEFIDVEDYEVIK
jgi:predicted DNA-binding protein YlxM (UPF0122 family)